MATEQFISSSTPRRSRLNLSSVATLFIVIAATVIGLIGIAVRGTSPWVLAVPLLVGVYAILTIRDEG